MLTGRLLLMLVVLTATLATRQPAALRASDTAAIPVERTTWVQRLGPGVARSFSRIGLMQRVALRVPAQRPASVACIAARPPTAAIDPLRTCLPPPLV